jgi:serine/threonine protein kinase/tetratricopeptide (TPR) repeat protein
MTEREIFDRALDIADLTQRAAYLDIACADNADMRRRLDDLLAAQDKLGNFLIDPPGKPLATLDHAPVTERPGSWIGPYRLMEQIGEGGFGLVFVAEQHQPVRRKVALKIIKPGMDSAQVIARFEAERQALAMMDHPNIARVLDAGTIASEPPTKEPRTIVSGPEQPLTIVRGSERPYFVMELVRGIPITEYCDQNQLTPRERLELFVTVCNAMQHAHQKGIIHRDIKPSNVLVTSHDGKPVAKVIDFGVAKALHQPLTERTIYTNFAQMIGTPLYMSPEQAEMSGLDIDTRSDIYSLGVLLYELLTGSTPLEKKRFSRAAYDEIRRMIREEEPPRPSQRLSTSDTLPSLAASRRTEPAKLSRMMRGELDWIVMKALEKDRTRRYESASSFARDIERHLRDEPVEACPPSAGYKLRKFVRRHRVGVMYAAGIVLAAVIALVGQTINLVQRYEAEAEATRERDRAVQAEELAQARLVQAENAAGAEKKARQQAQSRLKQIEKGTDLLGSIFANLDPSAEEKEGKSLRLILAGRLQKAARELDGQALGDPLTVAKLQQMLGRSLVALGETRSAIVLLEKALATRVANRGDDHDDTLASRLDLADAYRWAGKLKLAIPLLERTVKARETKLGDKHKDTLAVCCNLGGTFMEAGKLDLAIPLLERTLKTQEATLGDKHADTLTTRNVLASAYRAAAKFDLAVTLYQQTLKAQEERVGPEHVESLMARANLALAYEGIGKVDLAIPLLERTLKAAEAKLGEDHPATLAISNNLATAYFDVGKEELSFSLLQRTLRAHQAKHGEDHPGTAITRNNLGWRYLHAEKPHLAVPHLERALKTQEALLGDDHYDTLTTRNNLAVAFQKVGKMARALPLMESTLKASETNLGDDHPDTILARFNLGRAYRALGKLESAIALLEQCSKDQATRFGSDHRETLVSGRFLGEAYLAAGKQDLAIGLLQRTVKAYETWPLEKLKSLDFGGGKIDDATQARENLALAYFKAGKPNLAIPLVERALKVYETRLGDDHPSTCVLRENLAMTYRKAGKGSLTIPLFEKKLALSKAKHGPDHLATLAVMNDLAVLYWQAKKLDHSVPLFEELLKRHTARSGAEHHDTLQAMANLGVNYRDAARFGDGLPLLEKVAQASQKFVKLSWARTELLDGYLLAGDFGKAATLARELIAQARKTLPADSLPLASLLAQAGRALLSAKAWSEAEPVLRECLTIREEKAANDWATFNTRSMLGGCLLGQKKLADAEPLLLTGYAGMKARARTIPLAGKVRVSEAIVRLIDFYDASGKAEEAAKWRGEKDRIEGSVTGPVHEVKKSLELKGKLDGQTWALVYQVKLVVGKTYVIDMVSPDQKALDPYLVLMDSSGKTLAEDDDSGEGLNARITFRPGKDDTYRIQATSFGWIGNCEFALTVNENS